MNLVTLLNVVVSGVSATIWLVLFFALFEHASVLLRLAFVCIPTGQYVAVMLAMTGLTQPSGADLLTTVGVLSGTIWLARRKQETIAPFAKLSRWV